MVLPSANAPVNRPAVIAAPVALPAALVPPPAAKPAPRRVAPVLVAQLPIGQAAALINGPGALPASVAEIGRGGASLRNVEAVADRYERLLREHGGIDENDDDIAF